MELMENMISDILSFIAYNCPLQVRTEKNADVMAAVQSWTSDLKSSDIHGFLKKILNLQTLFQELSTIPN